MDISKKVMEKVTFKGAPVGDYIKNDKTEYVESDMGFSIRNSKINPKMQDVNVTVGSRAIYLDTVQSDSPQSFSVMVNVFEPNDKITKELGDKVLNDVSNMDFSKGAGLNSLCERLSESLKEERVTNLNISMDGVPKKALENNIDVLLSNVKSFNPMKFDLEINANSDNSKYEKCIIQGRNMGREDEDVKVAYENGSFDRYIPSSNPVMKSVLDTFNGKNDGSDNAQKQMERAMDM